MSFDDDFIANTAHRARLPLVDGQYRFRGVYRVARTDGGSKCKVPVKIDGARARQAVGNRRRDDACREEAVCDAAAEAHAGRVFLVSDLLIDGGVIAAMRAGKLPTPG